MFYSFHCKVAEVQIEYTHFLVPDWKEHKVFSCLQLKINLFTLLYTALSGECGRKLFFVVFFEVWNIMQSLYNFYLFSSSFEK